MNKHKAIAFSLVSTVLLSINLLFSTSPALAHHPMGGELPNNIGEGFISGLGHPVIAIDHLAFVIAIGLLAALRNKLGIIIPITFISATALGAGIHLQSINLPAPEIIISASVLGIGILLARANQANLRLLTGLAAIAGIFHGYAYAESVLGAEANTLWAYLLGFSLVQLIISAIAFYGGRTLLNASAVKSPFQFRFVGFAICGVGFTFFANLILALLFPV
jgi:urease accessory protein